GTGIPACIVVIDKEDAATRKGIFMVDASGGFRKDGAKNRLRERDIHRIVDVFNDQRDTPGYARMVPLDEIASDANDYNLNIPRYIDSGEPEDLHDLGAHLHGGIPDRDIDALDRYWKVFPGLRRALFAPGGRPGYVNPRTSPDEVREVVLGHGEFVAYRERVRAAFDNWRREHESRLYGLGVGDSPKILIRKLSEDLLDRFADLPLIDRFDVYQCLMDYWDEVMQDDVYLVVTDGWSEAARPRVMVGKRQAGESPDLTVRRTKYKMDLLPPDLVAGRYFAEEQREVEFLLAEQDRIGREVEAFVEENTSEDGLLDGATTDAGNVTQAAVRVRLREVRGGGGDPEERDTLEVCLDRMKAEAKAKRAAKSARSLLDVEILARYATLTRSEIADMVVRGKWTASLEDAVGRQVDRLTTGLVERVTVLEGRYAEALPELTQRAEELEARVRSHLRDLGIAG
ncbi:MAG: N-6 DNA methylase, partial [Gemmatimonadetes bacterium]|nr:N-6 DNA methylase [Gemmatimonadota bacterium]